MPKVLHCVAENGGRWLAHLEGTACGYGYGLHRFLRQSSRERKHWGSIVLPWPYRWGITPVFFMNSYQKKGKQKLIKYAPYKNSQSRQKKA